MDEIKCPKCESPRTFKQYIRAPFEDAVEIAFACGAKRKEDAKTRKRTWVRECGFVINNSY